MWKLPRAGSVLAAVAITVFSTACDEATRTITAIETVTDTVEVEIVRTDTVRVGNPNLSFNQIERLGRPLVSEALLEKRLHSFHNTTTPATDMMFFREHIIDFVVNVAGRDSSTATTIASVLLPDMLLVFPNRASGVTAANADDSPLVGYLTWTPILAGNEAFGGRKLDNDDAVDKSLGVVFGPLLSQENVSPGLATDNVPDTQSDPNTFPYVAPPR